MSLEHRPSASSNPLGARALALVLPAFLALSCAGASLVNVWKDPDYPQAPLTKLLVVAMNGDAATRRLWEDGFVTELKKHGVTATPSYRLFPDAPPDTGQVVETVRQSGDDGVLLTHRLATQTERRYVPGYVTEVPVTVLSPWGHYATYYREVFRRGHTETDRVVRHQTDVWSTRQGDRMVWSGIGEVIDPSSGDEIHREIAERVVPELARQSIIPNRAAHEVARRESGVAPGGSENAAISSRGIAKQEPSTGSKAYQ